MPLDSLFLTFSDPSLEHEYGLFQASSLQVQDQLVAVVHAVVSCASLALLK